jgi:hypothetical protein
MLLMFAQAHLDDDYQWKCSLAVGWLADVRLAICMGSLKFVWALGFLIPSPTQAPVNIVPHPPKKTLFVPFPK